MAATPTSSYTYTKTKTITTTDTYPHNYNDRLLQALLDRRGMKVEKTLVMRYPADPFDATSPQVDHTISVFTGGFLSTLDILRVVLGYHEGTVTFHDMRKRSTIKHHGKEGVIADTGAPMRATACDRELVFFINTNSMRTIIAAGREPRIFNMLNSPATLECFHTIASMWLGHKAYTHKLEELRRKKNKVLDDVRYIAKTFQEIHDLHRTDSGYEDAEICLWQDLVGTMDIVSTIDMKPIDKDAPAEK
jgi:hypothetical protein